MTAPSNSLSALPHGATSSVVSSIRQAARATHVDFGLLMAQAQQESGFQADAKATGSSAAGLYQFIDSTWLSMVQRFGAKYGAGAYAQQIVSDPSGHAAVADPATRHRILDLRKDPQLSAALAAEYTKLNKDELEQALGRSAGNADLYMAHFLGAAGATKFLKALHGSGGGNAVAADLLPDAAASNRAVFYDPNGRPRSVGEIYETFAKRINREAAQFADAAPAGIRSGVATDAPAFIRSLGFGGNQLTPPLAAMLNVFALSALKHLDATHAAIPHSARRST